MSGGNEANKEFKEQLRMQELYGQRNTDDSDPYSYTDPEDGTVYDWDHEKKAWFPKVWTLIEFFGFIFVRSGVKIQSLRLKSTRFCIWGTPNSYLYCLSLVFCQWKEMLIDFCR